MMFLFIFVMALLPALSISAEDDSSKEDEEIVVEEQEEDEISPEQIEVVDYGNDLKNIDKNIDNVKEEVKNVGEGVSGISEAVNETKEMVSEVKNNQEKEEKEIDYQDSFTMLHEDMQKLMISIWALSGLILACKLVKELFGYG